MREKSDEVLTELQNCPNGMFRVVKGLKTDSKEVEDGRCLRGSDGKLLCFSEKERDKVWKDYMDRIMNNENDWDNNMEGLILTQFLVIMITLSLTNGNSIIVSIPKRVIHHLLKTSMVLQKAAPLPN